MKIAITGATGFLGRELLEQLLSENYETRCWHRPQSTIQELDHVEWKLGELGDEESANSLVQGCDALIHAGLWRSTSSFRGVEPDLVGYVQRNIVGSIQLFEAAKRAGVNKIIFVSSCAVHEKILDDRPLDEAHPLWAGTHYGAQKAAIEKFVHSYGIGEGLNICAIRPPAIYGIDKPIEKSRWYGLAKAIAAHETVQARGGGKLVHVADVAKAIRLLLQLESIAGECFTCCEGYLSNYDVAIKLKEIAKSNSKIEGEPGKPKHAIDDSKFREIGMEYGGEQQLSDTLNRLLQLQS